MSFVEFPTSICLYGLTDSPHPRSKYKKNNCRNRIISHIQLQNLSCLLFLLHPTLDLQHQAHIYHYSDMRYLLHIDAFVKNLDTEFRTITTLSLVANPNYLLQDHEQSGPCRNIHVLLTRTDRANQTPSTSSPTTFYRLI